MDFESQSLKVDLERSLTAMLRLPPIEMKASTVTKEILNVIHSQYNSSSALS